MLFNIVGGADLSMNEVNEAAQIIAQAAEPDANIIFGAMIKEEMMDSIKISVIATGFDEMRGRLREYVGITPLMGNQGINSGAGQFSANSFNTQPASSMSSASSQSTDNNDSNSQKSVQDDAPMADDELEIPAFLRQNR